MEAMAGQERMPNCKTEAEVGEPTFVGLENGRFRCVETGHEMPADAVHSYARSKRCRLGLINHALSRNTPPLNMFKQDPLSGSKLICKLTGDSVNKSEEHIWKHINGKRFLNKLEQKEAGGLSPGRVKKSALAPEKVSKLMNGNVKVKDTRFAKLKPRRFSNGDSDSEEADFWTPPAGSRWDFDDGGEQEAEDNNKANGVHENHGNDSELSMRIKRMSIAVGPNSFASRKKKSKGGNSSC